MKQTKETPLLTPDSRVHRHFRNLDAGKVNLEAVAELRAKEEQAKDSKDLCGLGWDYLKAGALDHAVRAFLIEIEGLQSHVSEQQKLGDDAKFRPLRSAQILLTESSNTPNFFELELTISPHANYMGVAFSIGLVGKLEREVGSPPVPS